MGESQIKAEATAEIQALIGSFRPQHRKRVHKPRNIPESNKPLWTADQIRAKLRVYDRTPFLDLLAGWLECAPTPEAIIAFADKWPDRWASALLSISRVAGFAERREISADITGRVRVEHLSDSQLEDHLKQLAYMMGIRLPSTLTLRAQDAEEAEVQTSKPQTSEAADQQTSS